MERCPRKSEQVAREAKKSYEKPTLRKGPTLGEVTAAESKSSAPIDESDIRLKRDIHALDRLANGLTRYRFRYLWSEVEMVGVMAQDVLKVAPEAVELGADGFYRVDYGQLGIRCTTYAEWLAERPFAEAA